MEMILAKTEVVSVHIDGEDMQVLKRLCEISSFYLNDCTVRLSTMWENKEDITKDDLKRFVNAILGKENPK
jgi:hypothetical protein